MWRSIPLNLALLLLQHVPSALSITFDLPGQRRFTTEGLINLGSLGVQEDGLLAAWGDARGSQFTDLFILSPDQTSLSLYFWDRQAYSFRRSPQSPLQIAENAPSGSKITNVVPGDFNYDGQLDLLVMWQRDDYSHRDEIGMGVWMGNRRFAWASSPNITTSAFHSQPMLLDSEGDMRPDLLGFPVGGAGPAQLWKNRASETTLRSDQDSDPFFLSALPTGMENFDCKFPQQHSNALIDLDGDCLADLFLMCEGNSKDDLTYQIWVNDRMGGFKFARKGALPLGTKHVTFGDLDRDGTMDMIITACPSPSICSIITAHNPQMPLCSSGADKPCRDLANLCVADPNFDFNISPESESTTTYLISSILPQRPYLITSSGTNTFYPDSQSLPVNIKLGDYNLDGFPDLLVLSAETESGARNGLGVVSILENRPCAKGIACGTVGRDKKKGARGWSLVQGKDIKDLEDLKDVRGMGWMDLDEDGSLDIYVQRDSTKSGAARKINFIKNNFFHDAFFLKSLVLNDACRGYCEPKGEAKFRPYGVSYSGASYKFTILDPSGNRRAAHVGQLPQTSYMSMLTPYSYFGLGRTNNYVESLFVGTTRKSNVSSVAHFINIEGVIPNSQLIVQPLENDNWHKELYLRPGDWVFWVIVGIIGAMIILAGLVSILTLKEKQEDENERRRKLHSINFAAL